MLAKAQASAAMVFNSQLGWMAVELRGDTICELRFGHATPGDAIAALPFPAVVHDDPPSTWLELQRRLEGFAAGENIDFDEFAIDDQQMTPFQQRVLRRCRAIAFAETLSYGELAAEAGSPGAARAVGNIMASNRVPLVVPCHRVVGSHGSLGGYSGPQGIRMKQRLLALEGARVGRTMAANLSV